MLIALVGGRIVPSFTRNWLTKARPDVTPPAPEERFDLTALDRDGAGTCVLGLSRRTSAFSGLVLRHCRRRGRAAPVALARPLHDIREPLLLILHVGYGWLALGLVLLGIDRISGSLPPGVALHALTVGADRHNDPGGHDPGLARPYRKTADRRIRDRRDLRADYSCTALRIAAPFDPEAMQTLLSAAAPHGAPRSRCSRYSMALR